MQEANVTYVKLQAEISSSLSSSSERIQNRNIVDADEASDTGNSPIENRDKKDLIAAFDL